MMKERLKKLRQNEELSQRELAKKLNLSSSTVGMYETGDRKPDSDKLSKIADFFDVSVDYLLGRIDYLTIDDFVEGEWEKGLKEEFNNIIPDSELKNMKEEEKKKMVKDRFSIYKSKDGKYNFVPKKPVFREKIEIAKPNNKNNEDKFVKIPILGEVAAGKPLYAEENIIGYRLVRKEEINGANYFYLQVTGDSMTGSRIKEGDYIRVREQPNLENGEIGVVIINSNYATLKKVYKSDEKLILQPTNPDHDPIIVERDNARIIGRLDKLEVDY